MPTDQQFDPREALQKKRQQVVPTFDPREALARRNRGESPTVATRRVVGEILQNEFDPDQTAPMGMRWSLARGDTMEEKQARLKKFHENGELRVLGKSGVAGLPTDVLIWRESPEQKWKMVEPEGFDAFDIPEAVAGSAEAIGGEAIMAIGSRGASIPSMVARQGIGSFFGEGIEQAGQVASGTQLQDFSGAVGEMSKEGAASLIGGFGASPVVAAKNALTGRGVLQVGDQGIEALAAARRLDPKGLADKMTPGTVTDNPAIRLQEAQAGALLPGMQRRYRELTDRLNNIVKSKIDVDLLGQAMNRVNQSVSNLSRTFLEQVGDPRSPMGRGGRALKQGIKEYDEGAKALVDDMYGLARSLEEPRFDMSELANFASDMRKGKFGPVDPAAEKMLVQLEAISGPVPLSNGTLSVMDQLKSVRTEAFAMKNPGLGNAAGQKEGQAAAIFRYINGVMDEPLNANPAFKRAWKEAGIQAKQRFDTLEKAAVIDVQRSASESELARKFAAPGQVDFLADLRLTAPKQYWDEFTDSFKSDLLVDPSKLSGKLKAFDQETIDVLLTRKEQELFRKLGTEFDRIAKLGVDQMAERQVSNKQFVAKLIKTADPRDTQMIMRAINNTNDKAARDSLRAAILDWTWDGIVGETEMGLKVSRTLLKDRLKNLEDSGLMRMLPAETRKMLVDVDIVARQFERVMDAGTSIRAAEAAGGITRLKASAIYAFVQSGLVSHLYLSDFGRRLLIGKGVPNDKGQFLRFVGGVLAQTSTPEDISGLVSEESPRMKFAETR